MAHLLCRSALAILLLLAAGHGWADSAAAAPAGMLKRVIGEVLVLRANGATAAAAGQTVRQGDLIRTGPTGSVSVTLTDDTVLSAGPNSELEITRYGFDGTTHQGGMLLSIWRGAVAVVTGLLARQAPEQVKLQTRNIQLGVRGTEFIVDAGEGSR